MFRDNGQYEPEWIIQGSRWVRVVFYLVMLLLIGVNYLLKRTGKFDPNLLLLGFFVLFGVGLIITLLVERKVKTIVRLKKAKEYIELHPNLSNDKRDALLKGKTLDDMTPQEIEIATGKNVLESYHKKK